MQVPNNLFKGSNTNPDLVTHLLTLGIVEDPDDWVKATLLALSGKRGAAVERLLPYWPPAHQLPLYTAIHIGYLDGVRLLLEHGADYRTIDSFGEGILHWLAGSGLDMLRLFKGMGIDGIRGGGVDVERRDNRGKTAMEIMEGRWDLTEEFRREFVELVDGMREENEGENEERDGLAAEEEEVAELATAEAKDINQFEDDELSEDEFFDAPDDLGTTLTPATEELALGSAKRDVPQSDLEKCQSTEPSSVKVEALSPTPSEQCDVHGKDDEKATHGGETPPDEVETAGDDNMETTYAEQQESGLQDLDWADDLVHGGNAGQEKDPRKSRVEEPDTDKVFINEAGLKFRGTSTALRGQ